MKKDIKKLQNELNDILNEWDPIHVFDDGITDEYSSYTGRILSILVNENADREKIYVCINQIVDKIGLEQNKKDTKKVSDKIISWWSSQR